MYVNSGITRNNPSCFLFIIDQSASMGQQFGDRHEPHTKAEGVSDALNNLLRNLIITCSKSDGIRNYFDVGVIGYGETAGPAWSGPLFGRELVPIRDVAQFYTRTVERQETVKDPFGGESAQTVKIPVWVEAKARGSTPMCQALALSYEVLKVWLLRNQTCHPPVVVHITDGEATDGNPAPLMAALTELRSVNGPVTLFNVHLSSRREATPTSFPDSPEGLPDAYARTLFERSSYLTPYMRTVAWDHGVPLTEASRAFVLNADPTLLVLALEIGTRAGHVR
ncbi:MAG: vWA domain-containing protein [Capsulimonadales bacterium]|nr:vWA domain-containing protein [Capsulimonadales bacterium]